jgi:hypothetical protein
LEEHLLEPALFLCNDFYAILESKKGVVMANFIEVISVTAEVGGAHRSRNQTRIIHMERFLLSINME